MNKIKTLLLSLLTVALLAPAAMAQDMDLEDNFVVHEEMVVAGVVDEVLTSQHMVRLKTDHGAVIDVSMDALQLWSNEKSGYQPLEPGTYVSARMHPGLVTVSPAGKDRVWVSVEEEKFLRLYPRDFTDDLFKNDERVVELENGIEAEVSLAELLQDKANNILEIGNW